MPESAPRGTILIIEHESDSGASLLQQRAIQVGFGIEIATPEGGIPTSADGFVGVMPMGSYWSVNDEGAQSWFRNEVALLQDADARGIPVFGVCFGAQALAVALGGSVSRSSAPEIGWYTVDSVDEALIPQGPWFEWHVDCITPPADAEILAKSDIAVQAYTVRNHIAVQFHPEVTDVEIGQWSASEPAALAEMGHTRESILAQTISLKDESRSRAFALFDHFAARIAAHH